MSQKKSTAKSSSKGRAKGGKKSATQNDWSPEFTKRARAIIADADIYDERTREGIRRALEESDERLTDMVRAAEIRVSPEPADKTSKDWRYWKLRNLEFDLESDDEELRGRAWREFDELYQWFRGSSRQPASTARAVLPHLIIARQREGGETQADRLTQRAEAIIGDRKRYDSDTRRSIAISLKNSDPDTLAEDVRRAEAGETLLDCVEEEETRARREARRLLERSRRLTFDVEDYKPISFADVAELTEVMFGDCETNNRTDAKIHAFITLLYGMTHAHYEEQNRTGTYRGPAVESIAFEAASRAFAETAYFHDSKKEFAGLLHGVFKELAALHEQGEKGGGAK
jgi:hypothetical protein